MNPLMIRLAVLVALFGSIFLATQWVLLAYLNRRSSTRAVNRRLTLLRSGASTDAVSLMLRKDVLTPLHDGAGVLEKLYFRFQRMVLIAQLPLSPQTVLLGCAAAFVIFASLLLFSAWSAGFPITGGIFELVLGIAAAGAIVLPLLLIARRADRRRKRMQDQFPVAIDIFTRALRAGHPISAAIELLTEEMDDPLGSEFGLVADEVAYGANLTDALMSMAERWDLDDMRMFVTSLSLQNETGGNLAEILGNLAGVIRDRASLYMKVRALSSEGRMSGWMLTVLPILTLLSMFMVSPRFYFDVAMDPIFTVGFTGLIILYLIGVLTIRQMVNLKV